MTYRGYLKDSGGAKRLRFVMPGYDADDEGVPPNKVIFDSNDLGTLSVLDAGTYDFPSGSPEVNNLRIKSWSLNFVPLCHFWFLGTSDNIGEVCSLARNATVDFNKIIVSKDGIDVSMTTMLSGARMKWVAFNLKVI